MYGLICLLVVAKGISAEYYWQDYNNLEIPDNAIEGGVDTNGNTIFIGQAPYMWTAGNIPASIYQNKRGALTTALTLEVKIETGVKILCGDDDDFKWVKTQSTKIFDLPPKSCQIFIGGNEIGETIYIGRAHAQKQVMVGKVFPPGSIWKGLWLPWSGVHHNFNSFEILTYCGNDMQPIDMGQGAAGPSSNDPVAIVAKIFSNVVGNKAG